MYVVDSISQDTRDVVVWRDSRLLDTALLRLCTGLEVVGNVSC